LPKSSAAPRAGINPENAELRNELPEEKDFSERNIKRMVQFWSAYPQLLPIGPRAVAQIPWGHNAILMEKIKPTSTDENRATTDSWGNCFQNGNSWVRCKSAPNYPEIPDGSPEPSPL
jgi:hypothetical protein